MKFTVDIPILAAPIDRPDSRVLFWEKADIDVEEHDDRSAPLACLLHRLGGLREEFRTIGGRLHSDRWLDRNVPGGRSSANRADGGSRPTSLDRLSHALVDRLLAEHSSTRSLLPLPVRRAVSEHDTTVGRYAPLVAISAAMGTRTYAGGLDGDHVEASRQAALAAFSELAICGGRVFAASPEPTVSLSLNVVNESDRRVRTGTSSAALFAGRRATPGFQYYDEDLAEYWNQTRTFMFSVTDTRGLDAFLDEICAKWNAGRPAAPTVEVYDPEAFTLDVLSRDTDRHMQVLAWRATRALVVGNVDHMRWRKDVGPGLIAAYWEFARATAPRPAETEIDARAETAYAVLVDNLLDYMDTCRRPGVYSGWLDTDLAHYVRSRWESRPVFVDIGNVPSPGVTP